MSNRYVVTVLVLPPIIPADPIMMSKVENMEQFSNVLEGDAMDLREQMVDAKYDSVAIRYLDMNPLKGEVKIIPKKRIASLKISPQ